MCIRDSQRPLALLVLDCDNFKSVNDRFGHLDGDKVLQALAGVIGRCLRNSDSGFRYGGEEFILLLPETTGEAARILAERLRAGFANEAIESGSGLPITCTVSIGAVSYTHLRAHETVLDLVCRLLLEKKKQQNH